MGICGDGVKWILLPKEDDNGATQVGSAARRRQVSDLNNHAEKDDSYYPHIYYPLISLFLSFIYSTYVYMRTV